ncbi:MAG: acetyl-CoA carboxylase biotin carboxyl carrier protein subunit [Chloroflexi bacterium]|nr:acetyl-CoA carboxylase biotin carboxyl carrier protein subunit [Chloroflexota bacterium]MDA1147856.1 acetyl-CoA carboxylase biotin carboxyl carrier protein subunit [Chloroflexota bacterium]
MTNPSAATDVRAEWPGRVAEIHVAVGDEVTAGQELITLESMKMLTPLSAPQDGRVAEILVAIDDFVDEGAVVVRL